jgi:hypothetical protein
VPTTYASNSIWRGFRRSTAPRPTWVQRWHISSRPILHPRPKRPWPTSGSPQGGGEERDVQVGCIYVKPALAQPI